MKTHLVKFHLNVRGVNDCAVCQVVTGMMVLRSHHSFINMDRAEREAKRTQRKFESGKTL